MKVIYKYPISVTEKQFISIPVDAKILTVGIQNDIPCVWALVDDSLPISNVLIRIYPTGVEIDNYLTLKYLGTLSKLSANIIYHIFIDEQGG